MYKASLLTSIVGAAALALPQDPSWESWTSSAGAQSPGSHALYTITNDISGNEVVAIGINSDGSLSGGKQYATGGIGGNYVSAADGKPLFPDSLSGQDAVVRAGNYVFVVNAGSNTVSMFSISSDDATSLTLLGQPAPSKGDFPTNLAASSSLGQVCVGNSGAVSGISCSTFTSAGLAGFDALRAMDVGEKSTPPIGAIPGLGDILFSEDDTSLLALVKGNGTMFQGYASVFPVSEAGQVSQTASTMVTPPDSKVLFGTSTIPGQPDLVLASDAGFGALTLNLSSLAAAPVATVNVTGQKASCWAQVTGSGRGFITDALVNRLVEVNVYTGAVVKEFYPPTPFQGMTDFVIADDYLWVLSASNGSYATSVSTFNIGGGPGSIEFEGVFIVPGAAENTQGLAFY